MIVRKLRMTVPQRIEEISSIDSVDDPYMLAHRLMNLEAIREQRQPDHKLRMSQIYSCCVRKMLLCLRNDVSSIENVPLSLRVTFDIGTAVHEFLQNTEGYLGKNRIGWWLCRACGHKIFGRKPKQKCSFCGASERAAFYHEHALKIEDLPVSGHIDCFIECKPGDVRIVDFKTINGEEFEKLTAPKVEHVVQVIGYMKYIQLDKTMPIKINPHKGMVLYIRKKLRAKGIPFKVFHVERLKCYEDEIDKKVNEFSKGLFDKSFLSEPIYECVRGGFKSYNSRQCPVLLECKKLCGG